MGTSSDIGALLRRMEGLLAPLEAAGDPGRFFLATYLRTTRAVAEELDRGGFRDPGWVERWDVAFADLYRSCWPAGAPTTSTSTRSWFPGSGPRTSSWRP